MTSNTAKTAARQRPGNKRVTGKEQYYTPKDLAQKLIKEVEVLVPDLARRAVIEPAGGTGSFIEAARTAGVTDFLSFDIEPKHSGIAAGNFLEAEIAVRLRFGHHFQKGLHRFFRFALLG